MEMQSVGRATREHGIRVRYDPEGPSIGLGTGHRLYRRWRAEVNGGEYPPCVLDVEVTPSGRPRCLRLTVDSPGDEGLTSADLRRIPVARLMEAAIELATVRDEHLPLRPHPDDLTQLTEGGPIVAGNREYDRWRKQARVPRRGLRLRDDDLLHVGEVYRAALDNGDPPTQKVKEVMNVSRSTAGRWVAEARKRGLLGPAPGQRQAGESVEHTTDAVIVRPDDEGSTQ